MSITSETETDILIIGGGVIGSAIAYECARAGRRVTLVDQQETGAEASRAAAGMLGAQVESHHPGPFFELSKASRAMYRDWATELERISGCSIEYVAHGILRVALTVEDENELRARLPWLNEGDERTGEEVRWLSAEEVAALEPAISGACRGGLYFADDHQVHAPRLARALRAALDALGVRVMEHAIIEDWLLTGQLPREHRATPEKTAATKTVRGVQVRSAHATGSNTDVTSATATVETILAKQVVVAAGAWSPQILASLGLQLPVKPVKGQCFALRPSTTLITRTVFTKGCYVVPKSDGTLVVGASEEDSGFDKQPNPLVVKRIQETAYRLIPALATAQFVDTWTGLRPASADGIPFMGHAPGWHNLFVAAGHYRNGILLTPVTARIMSELMLTGTCTLPLDLSAFTLERTAPSLT